MVNKIEVPIVLLDHARGMPEYRTAGAAGMDLVSCDKVTLLPQETTIINTGICIAIPENYEAIIRTRSGIAVSRGLVVLNSPGTIDSDYRGQIGVILHNNSKGTRLVNPGDRIAQLVFTPVVRAIFREVSTLDETERNKKGFGSTGIN